jgi:glycine betaine/proline transport system ATP-binding protein
MIKLKQVLADWYRGKDAATEPTSASKTLKDGVQIKNLYKIFGPDAQKLLPLVKDGMSKEQLKQEHNHVLGLNNINLDIKAGSIQVIMGLSGSGKSTLIRHINRLIEPTAGEVWVDDRDVAQLSKRAMQVFRRDQMAMVFQKFALFPHYTVSENVALGPTLRNVKKDVREATVSYWIDRVGLAGYEDSYPNQLSGGMQQRVGLARALANDAPILLMDEAFSALDPLIRTDMQSVLLDLQQEISKTIIFITHDLEEALRLGDRIAILREGEIIQQGTPSQIIMEPADNYIKNFTRDVNRGRVIRCKTIMQSVMQDDDLPVVDSELVIEEALRIISASQKEAAHVHSRKNKRIGSIRASDILAVMLPPESEQ